MNSSEEPVLEHSLCNAVDVLESFQEKKKKSLNKKTRIVGP